MATSSGPEKQYAVTPTREIKLRPLAVAVAASLVILLSLWVTGWATKPDPEFAPFQQTSPLDPFLTATPDPFAVPTETPDPFAAPTELPDPFAVPTETPDPFAIPTATPDPFAVPTETPTTVFPGSVAPEEGTATPAETTDLSVVGPQAPQPGIQLAVTPPPDPFNYVGSVVTSMASVAAWIWLLCGSLIFFVVAGLVGGLYLSRQERERYELYVLEPDESPHLEVTKPQPKDDPDDIWPASLP